MRRNEHDAHRDLCDRADERDWLDDFLPAPEKADRFILQFCSVVVIVLLAVAAFQLWSTP